MSLAGQFIRDTMTENNTMMKNLSTFSVEELSKKLEQLKNLGALIPLTQLVTNEEIRDIETELANRA